jgi:hypothetical protein
MTAIVKGYTVGVGTSEEGAVYRVPMSVGAVGGETTIWAVHDVLKGIWEDAFPTTFVSEVIRHEAEDVVLTHP